MDTDWCSLAPIKYVYSDLNLDVPFEFSKGVFLDEIPKWFRDKKFLDTLSLGHRIAMNKSKYTLITYYQASALGSPDSEYKGPGSRSIQDAKTESFNLVNIAIWLTRPCSLVFDVVFHIDDVKGDKNIRSTYQVRELEVHLKNAKDKLDNTDLLNARKVMQSLIGLSRDTALWISIYSLSCALREPIWVTRYALIWIALESLFGCEDGAEISFRISQRIGFFLGPDRAKAQVIAQRIKELYRKRSKVVHGVPLSRHDHTNSIELSFDAENYLRISMLKILDSKELTERFSTRKRDEYLDGLVYA